MSKRKKQLSLTEAYSRSIHGPRGHPAPDPRERISNTRDVFAGMGLTNHHQERILGFLASGGKKCKSDVRRYCRSNGLRIATNELFRRFDMKLTRPVTKSPVEPTVRFRCKKVVQKTGKSNPLSGELDLVKAALSVSDGPIAEVEDDSIEAVPELGPFPSDLQFDSIAKAKASMDLLQDWFGQAAFPNSEQISHGRTCVQAALDLDLQPSKTHVGLCKSLGLFDTVIGGRRSDPESYAVLKGETPKQSIIDKALRKGEQQAKPLPKKFHPFVLEGACQKQAESMVRYGDANEDTASLATKAMFNIISQAEGRWNPTLTAAVSASSPKDILRLVRKYIKRLRKEAAEAEPENEAKPAMSENYYHNGNWRYG